MSFGYNGKYDRNMIVYQRDRCLLTQEIELRRPREAIELLDVTQICFWRLWVWCIWPVLSLNVVLWLVQSLFSTKRVTKLVMVHW